jgi:hypothetical protein
MPKPAGGAQRASASQESLKDSLKESQNEAPEAMGWAIAPDVDVDQPEAGDTARYIAQMTGELTALGAAAGLETLGYLLAMARVEAELAARDAED